MNQIHTEHQGPLQTAFKAFLRKNLACGRLVSYSKSRYRDQNPNNIVMFNANIFVEDLGKIWYGDLDLTVSESDLRDIATEIGKPLYILREMDGRWTNDELDIRQIRNKAVTTITPWDSITQ